MLTAKMPYIKAGCEGIDIFAGAFSWVNSAQFTTTLKAIGQNAIGYAFHLGLEVVCPTCLNQLTKLQNFMNQINKMTSDSCLAAKTLVNGGLMAFTDMSVEHCKVDEKAFYTDRVAGWLDCAGKSESEVTTFLRSKYATATGLSSSDETPSPSKTGHDEVRLALRGLSLTHDEFQMAISILGTAQMEWKSDNSKQECKRYDKKVTLDQLIDGGKVNMWKCNNGNPFDDTMSCPGMEPEEVQLEGLRTKAKKILTSIYEKLSQDAASIRVLSLTEETFIKRSSSVNVYSAMKDLAALGTAGQSVALAAIDLYAHALAVDYAWNFVELYMHKTKTGQNNAETDCAIKKENLAKILQDMETTRLAELTKINQQAISYNIMTEFAKSINTMVMEKTGGVMSALAKRN